MTTVERLTELRDLLTEARAVPMSASCLVNRADALAVVERALAELPEELAAAEAVVAAREAERLKGRDEGDRIRQQAEEWATSQASQTEINRRAQEAADRLLTEAREESAGLRAETDAYVDQRMAEFEAALQKTHSQVRIMRARLAERAGDDTPPPLPPL